MTHQDVFTVGVLSFFSFCSVNPVHCKAQELNSSVDVEIENRGVSSEEKRVLVGNYSTSGF